MKNSLFIFLFITSAVFSQENPWENKNKENPWGTETKESRKNSEEKKDSLFSENKEVVLDSLDEKEYNLLLKQAGDQAVNNYNAALGFGIGLGTGITMNVFGGIADLIYVMPTTKREKRIALEVENDTTYKNIPVEVLRKETKRRITTKKAILTFAGTALGSLMQVAVVYIGIFYL